MNIFPAIDIYEGKVVRLFKGDYNQMTVYSDNPLEIAGDFATQGAKFIHVVDLEGAKSGTSPNAQIIADIKRESGLFVQTGGGIRNSKTVKMHLDSGIDRVILGTSAVENLDFLKEMVNEYNDKIAVGVDIKDGFVATRGWVEQSQYKALDFFEILQDIGVDCVVCTDISKDGAMQGTNTNLYQVLKDKFNIKIIASGGVSSLDDVVCLHNIGVYGAIIGKAYYTGDIDLKRAIEVA